MFVKENAFPCVIKTRLLLMVVHPPEYFFPLERAVNPEFRQAALVQNHEYTPINSLLLEISRVLRAPEFAQNFHDVLASYGYTTRIGSPISRWGISGNGVRLGCYRYGYLRPWRRRKKYLKGLGWGF